MAAVGYGRWKTRKLGNHKPFLRAAWLVAPGALLAGCLVIIWPRVTVEPSSLEFVAPLGGEDPPSQVLTIADPGTPRGPYQATASAGWVTVTWACVAQWDGDKIYPTPVAWEVSVALQGRPEGEYHASIRITDRFGLPVAWVPVTLTIILDDCIVFPNLDTFDAVGVIAAAPEKWVNASDGRITHVLEGAEDAKLRLAAGSLEMAEALAASEGRRAVVSGYLPDLHASWDCDGPVPPEGEVTSLQPLVISIEAYGSPVPAATVAQYYDVPEGSTHAFIFLREGYPQPWPEGFYPEQPYPPIGVRHFLEPTALMPDLAPFEGATVRVEGDFVGFQGTDPRIIRVRAVEEVSDVAADRVSGAVGMVMVASVGAPPGASHELCLPSADPPGGTETLFYLSGESAVDLGTIEGSWVEISGQVTEGSGLGTLTLAVDSATVLPGEPDRRDRVRLSGRVERKDESDPFAPSAATHNLVKDAGPMLPAFWTAAHLRSEEPGLLEGWEGFEVVLEGIVDSWITWEGAQSFGTLVNVTGIGPSLPPPDIDGVVPPPDEDFEPARGHIPKDGGECVRGTAWEGVPNPRSPDMPMVEN